MNTTSPSTAIVGLAVALGIGLIVGVERERRKGDGDRRAAAGLRTFAIVALAGAIAQILPVLTLVPIGGALVAILAAVSHWKSRSQDPGMTTEIALFATYLIGVLCVIEPSLGAACGTGLALLLAARRRLHRFATELLGEQELHDGVLLAALALIALPLIPSRPIEMLGGINPRPLASMVLLIMAIQAAGQAAVRWLGVRGGLLGAGFASGFVSSTATVASFGNRARDQPLHTGLLAGAAALSAVATWVLALAMTAALSPQA
ncbi:MgtC/SapB family protein, partial [Variovorax sp. Varisp62]|uniref:MgtC/SapB family protein n=1 Tax=Variovorax sp. Varisp62 TaxID=3243049 RepID=UPI0039B51585